MIGTPLSTRATRMRTVAIVVLLFFALGGAVFAVTSAVAGHNMLSSIDREQTKTSLNFGVFSNAFVSLTFVSAAVLLIRSRPRGQK